MSFVGDRDGRMQWWLERTSAASAAVIVPLVVDLLRPASVLDVGCGNGAWLGTFGRAGIHDLLGLDGAVVDAAALHVDADRFRAVDLLHPPPLGRQYDLVCCLEVAEHLPQSSASLLIDYLVTSSARAVLFSAAIPGQGGMGHINEQWPDFWHALFQKRGFQVVDILRHRLWDDTRVAYYYRQNMFLFVQASLVGNFERAGTRSFPLRAVHPELFQRATRKRALDTYTPRQLIWALRRSLRAALIAKFSRGAKPRQTTESEDLEPRSAAGR